MHHVNPIPQTWAWILEHFGFPFLCTDAGLFVHMMISSPGQPVIHLVCNQSFQGCVLCDPEIKTYYLCKKTFIATVELLESCVNVAISSLADWAKET